MNNSKVQKTISQKLNGSRELGQGINQKEVKIKEVLLVQILKNYREISNKINTIPEEINLHKNNFKNIREQKISCKKWQLELIGQQQRL